MVYTVVDFVPLTSGVILELSLVPTLCHTSLSTSVTLEVYTAPYSWSYIYLKTASETVGDDIKYFPRISSVSQTISGPVELPRTTLFRISSPAHYALPNTTFQTISVDTSEIRRARVRGEISRFHIIDHVQYGGNNFQK
jgi:hypothetical protein